MSHPTLSPGTTRTSTIHVLRPDPYALLTSALAEVVAADATLANAGNSLLAPLRLLDAIGQEAEAALGDDVIAAERLRMLITMAPAQTQLTSILPAMFSALGNAAVAGEEEDVDEKTALEFLENTTPCEPALIDFGALVMVGLAVGRVGEARGLTLPMLRNLMSIALAAGPAEALVRALSDGLSTQQVAAILTGLTQQEAGKSNVSASLSGFLTDKCEQLRWLCLYLVFQQVARDVASVPWDAAGSGSIVSVRAIDACVGDEITLQLAMDTPVILALNSFNRTAGSAGSDDEPLNGVHFLPRLEGGTARVVFAAIGKPAIAQPPESVDPNAGTVTVVVPDGVQPGWIGFVDDDLLEASNTARELLRSEWDKRNGEWGCLQSAPVPTTAIPLLPDPPTPPRTAEARFQGGVPLILHAQLTPDTVSIGDTLQLQWAVSANSKVAITPSVGSEAARGSVDITAGPERARIAYTIRAQRCDQTVEHEVSARVRARIDSLTITQNGEPSPLITGESLQVSATISPPDSPGPAALAAGTWVRIARPRNGQLTFTIPENVVVDGLVGTLRMLSPSNRVDDERSFGPLRIVKQEKRTIVLVRPAIINRTFHRVKSVEITEQLAAAARERALALKLLEPAWIDDQDITCLAEPDGPDVPEARRLLERLNVLAARHPGLEDALWLAIVPKMHREPGFCALEPAEGARAVAVCTPDQLDKLFDTPLPELGPRTMRLRIIGVIGSDLSVRIENMRVEERSAGMGAPVSTDLAVFGLVGKEIRTSYPVRLMSRSRPARLVALMPITQDMDTLVVGRSEYDGDELLAFRRVQRPVGKPEVKGVTLADEVLSWDYSHSKSARARFSVEVGNNGFWSPVAVLGHCAESAEIPLAYLSAASRAERVRVVASDGWNSNVTKSLRLPELPEHRVIIRSAGPGRLWADVNFDGDESELTQITWKLGKTTKTGPLLVLPTRYDGPVSVRVRGPEGTLTDGRDVNEGGVDDRALKWSQDGVHA